MKGIDWEADVIEADPTSAAYQAGWQARVAGIERKANPHGSGLDRAQWNKGWDAAGLAVR